VQGTRLHYLTTNSGIDRIPGSPGRGRIQPEEVTHLPLVDLLGELQGLGLIVVGDVAVPVDGVAGLHVDVARISARVHVRDVDRRADRGIGGQRAISPGH